jgi:hypothetical protein
MSQRGKSQRKDKSPLVAIGKGKATKNRDLSLPFHFLSKTIGDSSVDIINYNSFGEVTLRIQGLPVLPASHHYVIG